MEEVNNERVKRADFRAGRLEQVIRAIAGDKKAAPFDAYPRHRPKVTKAENLNKRKENFKAIVGQKQSIKSRRKNG